MRKFTALFCLLVYSLMLSGAKAQYIREFVQTYNGADDFGDISYAMDADENGNIYTAGTTFSRFTFQDLFVTKYSSTGNLLWIRFYNSEDSSNDAAKSVTVDRLGNVIVAGETMRSMTGNDIVIIKYNPDGIELWKKFFNRNGNNIGKNNELCKMVMTDAGNNVIVCGSSQASSTDYDFFVQKYNPNGNLLFTKTYSGNGNNKDFLNDMTLDISGNIYVTGEAFFTSSRLDYLTVKYDSSGNLLWTSVYNNITTNFSDKAYGICLDSDRNVIVTGLSTTAFLDDVVTVKYSAQGNVIWEAVFSGAQELMDIGYDVAADEFNNIFISASVTEITSFPEFAVMKYDSSGNLNWIRVFDHTGIGSGSALRIFCDKQDNVYASGIIGRLVSQTSINDIIVVKYDNSGNILWSDYFNGTGNNDDYISGFMQDTYGNILVTGKSITDILNYDCLTVKYSLSTGLNQISDSEINEFKLYQNYPNPFNPETKIRFSVAGINNLDIVNLSLKVYDITGKELTNLFSGNVKSGTYEAVWNASEYPSGIYFCKLKSEFNSGTIKLLLIK